MRRARGVAGVAVLALLSGCGVPTDGEASRLDADDVPFGLLDPRSEEPPTPAPTAGDVVQVHLLQQIGSDGGVQLVAVDRPAGGVAEVVDALLAGPTAAEAARGLASALPDADVVRDVEVTAGVASLDLADGFATLDNRDQRLALAQLVFTLTGQPGVGRVAITLEGRSVAFPRGDGSLATGTVSRESYVDLGPAE